MNTGLETFWEAISSEQEMALATSAGGRVTMRTVSPVLYENSILIFTASDSVKYYQLKENPNCCVKVGAFYAEAAAEFPGPTMLDKNAALRAAYEIKFNRAFDPDIEYGGYRADFILLRPRLVKGWIVGENDEGTPFEFKL